MEVNVTKRIETRSGSRYCPVVVNSSGQIKSDWVIVNGNQERHPEGSYSGIAIMMTIGNRNEPVC